MPHVFHNSPFLISDKYKSEDKKKTRKILGVKRKYRNAKGLRLEYRKQRDTTAKSPLQFLTLHGECRPKDFGGPQQG